MTSKTGKGDAATSVPLRKAGSFDLSLFVARYGTIFALLILVIAFTLASGNFLTSRNLINVMRQVSVLTVISAGITIAVAGGEFDLSLGQVASMSMILVAGLMVRQEKSAFISILVAVAAGAVFGLINGLLGHTRPNSILDLHLRYRGRWPWE